MDAVAIKHGQLVGGARRSTLEEAPDWALWAERDATGHERAPQNGALCMHLRGQNQNQIPLGLTFADIGI